MTFSNPFQVLWWFLIIIALSGYLHDRYADLVEGAAVPADVVVFLVWVGLLLVPIFREVSLFGLNFKQQIEELKTETKANFDALRADIRQVVDVKTSLTQYISQSPPPDDKLPEIEARIKAVVEATFAERGTRAPDSEPKGNLVPEDLSEGVMYLVRTRLKLEKEIRRIARMHPTQMSKERKLTIYALLSDLIERELVEPQLMGPVRELYAVCSAAIHGEEVTAAQVAFVRDVGPSVIHALRALP